MPFEPFVELLELVPLCFGFFVLFCPIDFRALCALHLDGFSSRLCHILTSLVVDSLKDFSQFTQGLSMTNIFFRHSLIFSQYGKIPLKL